MANRCSVYGKGPQFGRSIRYGHGGKWERRAPRTNRRWPPNLQSARTMVDGVRQRVRVCTRCLRSNKVTKAA